MGKRKGSGETFLQKLKGEKNMIIKLEK